MLLQTPVKRVGLYIGTTVVSILTVHEILVCAMTPSRGGAAFTSQLPPRRLREQTWWRPPKSDMSPTTLYSNRSQCSSQSSRIDSSSARASPSASQKKLKEEHWTQCRSSLQSVSDTHDCKERKVFIILYSKRHHRFPQI